MKIANPDCENTLNPRKMINRDKVRPTPSNWFLVSSVSKDADTVDCTHSMQASELHNGHIFYNFTNKVYKVFESKKIGSIFFGN